MPETQFKTFFILSVLITYTLFSQFLQAAGVGDVSPSVTTPRIEPKLPGTDAPGIILPTPIVKEVPAGAEQFTFILKKLEIEGAFGEVVNTLPDIYEEYIGQEITIVDLFEIAGKIQNAYHETGYFLVQVYVPAQTIENGVARIVIFVGFISDIDVSALPERYQNKTKSIFAELLNTPHVLRQQLERKLLLANNLSGLTIETTLMPGKEPRSTILVVEGKDRLVTGMLTFDNYASLPLKETEGLLALSLHSPTGNGEEFSFLGSFHPSLNEIGRDQPIKLSGNIAADIPVGNNGLAVHMDVIRSITHPRGKITPLQLRGRLNSWTAGLSYPLVLTRRNALNLDALFEYTDEVLQTDLAGPRVTLNHDSLRILRFGTLWSHKRDNGSQFLLGGRISHGLNAFGARDDPSSGASLSRVDGKADFLKFEADMRLYQPLSENYALQLSGKTQLTPDPLLVPEQFTLGGPEFGSGHAVGAVLGDYGFAVRSELQKLFPREMGNYFLGTQPYLFADYGRAYLKKPTVVEEKSTPVANTGIGLRLSLFDKRDSFRSLSVSIEYALQLDGPPDEDNGDKLSFIISAGF